MIGVAAGRPAGWWRALGMGAALMLAGLIPLGGRAQQDEFVEWDGDAATTAVCTACASECGTCPGANPARRLLVAMLVATAIAGLLVRYPAGRRLRPVFLLLSVGAYGFYWGGCPCPIQGFQQIMVAFETGAWWTPAVLWLLAVMILAWLLGPTWCGWVCHLGALQELLYRVRRGPVSAKAPHAWVWARRAMVLAFVVSLVLTRTIWWEQVDPFQTIFNLKTAARWALTVALLLALISLAVYRPFCRTLCPVGLLLGLISRLPWARGPVQRTECHACVKCRASCRMGAIGQRGRVDREFCIACGDCLDGCPTSGIGWGVEKTQGKMPCKQESGG